MEQPKPLNNEFKKEEIITDNERESDQEKKPSVAEVNDPNLSCGTENMEQSDEEEQSSVAEVNDPNLNFGTENMEQTEPTAEETNMTSWSGLVSYRYQYYAPDNKTLITREVVFRPIGANASENESEFIAQAENLNRSLVRHNLQQNESIAEEMNMTSGSELVSYRNQYYTPAEQQQNTQVVVFETTTAKATENESTLVAQEDNLNRSVIEENMQQAEPTADGMNMRSESQLVSYRSQYYTRNEQNQITQAIVFGTMIAQATENESEFVAQADILNRRLIQENMQRIQPTAEEMNMTSGSQSVSYRTQYCTRDEQNQITQAVVIRTMGAEATGNQIEFIAQPDNLNRSVIGENMQQSEPKVEEMNIRSEGKCIAYRNEFFSNSERNADCKSVVYEAITADTKTKNETESIQEAALADSSTQTPQENVQQIMPTAEKTKTNPVKPAGKKYIAYSNRYYTLDEKNNVHEIVVYGTVAEGEPGPSHAITNENIRYICCNDNLPDRTLSLINWDKPKKSAEEVALIKILKEWIKECLRQRYYLNSAFIKKAAYEIIEYLDSPDFCVTTWWIKKFMKKYDFMQFEITENYDPELYALIHISIERIIARVQYTLPREVYNKIINLIKSNMNNRGITRFGKPPTLYVQKSVIHFCYELDVDPIPSKKLENEMDVEDVIVENNDEKKDPEI